jgi:DNA repair photolyase
VVHQPLSGVLARLPFCYARRTHWFLDEDGVADWSSRVFVKINAPEILRRELARPAWKREEVALGTATDPYQAIESRYTISRRILEALRDYRTPVGIVTRSPIVTRDLDVLTELTRCAGATVCVSIATIDDRIAREIEPTVALPAQRLLTVRRLTAAGIRAGIILAPILPGITDGPAQLDAVVRAARQHGAHFVHHNALHLGDVTREAFFQFLGRRHPALLPRYLRMYRGKYAPQPYRAAVGAVVEDAKRRHEIQGRRHQPPAAAPDPEPAQLPLFGDA